MDALIKKNTRISQIYKQKNHCLKEEIIICTVRDSPNGCRNPIHTPLR